MGSDDEDYEDLATLLGAHCPPPNGQGVQLRAARERG
jgi:hypothetical protein